MIKKIVITLFTFIFLLMSFPWSISNAADSEKNTYLIKFSSDSVPVELLDKNIIYRYENLSLLAANLTNNELNELSNSDVIEYTELDTEISVPSLSIIYSRQKELNDSVNEEVSEAVELNNDIGLSPVKVALIDTGINFDVLENVNVLNSYNVHINQEVSILDQGTYAANIISSINVPIELYDYKVFDSYGKGKTSDFLKAIDLAVSNNVNVINMNVVNESYSIATAEMLSIAEANDILLIAPAGDNGKELMNYPAAFNSVIAVGSIKSSGEKLSTSNYGNKLELVALGEGIVKKVGNNKYAEITGTTTSAAVVTQIASKYLYHFPSVSVGSIREMLKSSAIQLGGTETFGYGEVNFNSLIEDESIENQSRVSRREGLASAQSFQLDDEETVEEIGEFRLQNEIDKLNLDRQLVTINSQRNDEDGKVTIDDLINEYHIDKEEILAYLSDGYTLYDLSSYYLNLELNSTSKNAHARRNISIPTKKNALNDSEQAVSTIKVNAGSDMEVDLSNVDVIEDLAIETNLRKNTLMDEITLKTSTLADSTINNMTNVDEKTEKTLMSTESSIAASINEVVSENSNLVNEDSIPILLINSFSSPLTTEEPEIQKPITKQSEAPYSVTLYNEDISLLSGGLGINQKEFTLPGRNGLSFTLNRIYNSNNSQIYAKDVDYNYSDYEYNVYAKQTVTEEEYSYKVKYYYQMYLRKYDCSTSPEIKVGTDDPVGIGYKTSNSFSSLKAAESVKNSPPIYVREVKHACGIQQKDRIYYHEYVYTHSEIITELVDTNTLPSNEVIIGTFKSYSDAEAFQLSVQKGEQNFSFHNGNKKYILVYSLSNRGIEFVVKSVNYFNRTKDDPLDKKFPIGKGWSWNIPYVTSENGKVYISLEDGGTYEVVNQKLEGYEWSDLSFVNDSSGISYSKISQYALKSVYGTNYYFDQNGNLILIKDNYDNTIKFAYTSNNKYGEVLSYIEDAIGNKINLEYQDNKVIITSDGRTITYEKMIVNGVEVLSKVIDSLNRTTTYSYDVNTAKFNLLGTTPEVLNPYVLLTQVHHPTGFITKYEYEKAPVKRFLNNNQVNQVYRIASRVDQVNYSNNTTENYNYASIVYSSDMGVTYGTDTTFNTTLFNNNLYTIESFSKKYTNNKPKYYLTQRTTKDDKVEKVESFTYDQEKSRTAPLSYSYRYKNISTGVMTTPVSISKEYDDYKNITKLTNETGLISTFNFSTTTHLLTNSTEKVSGDQSIYTHIVSRNLKGDITEVKKYENNQQGVLLSHFIYQYDQFGNITLIREVRENKNIETNIEYSTQYNNAFPTKVTKPYTAGDLSIQNVVNSATYNKARGTLLTFTDGNNGTTWFQYDNKNRVTQIKNADNSLQKTQYDDIQNEIIYTNETQIKTYQKYNPLGLIVEEGYFSGENKISTAKHGYDQYSRQIWSENALGTRTTYTYDRWNRVTSTKTANIEILKKEFDDMLFQVTFTTNEGVSTRSISDRFGNLINKQLKNGNNYVTEWSGTYDSAHRLISSQDANNFVTTYEYSVNNELLKVVSPDSTVNQYIFKNGLLVQKVSPLYSIESYEYDELGRVIIVKDDLKQEEKYEYDANNNVIKYTDKKNQTYILTYNKRDLLINNQGSSSSIAYDYDLSGKRTSMRDNGNRLTTYEYHPLTGLLENVQYPDGKHLRYIYDRLGRVEFKTTPFGDQIAYEYDNLNRMKTVKWNSVVQANYEYVNNKPIDKLILPNGIETRFSFSSFGTIKDLDYYLNGSKKMGFSYVYDSNNNVKDTYLTKNGNLVGENHYTYDSMNRIKTNSQNSESYNYDSNGNRAIINTASSANATLPFQFAFTYDQWNRLTKATNEGNKQVEYIYNGDGLLVERKESGETIRYYYDGDKIIAEGKVNSDNSVTPVASYLYGKTGLILREDEINQSKAYYLHNGHGDVVELVNQNGQTLNSYSYDIWGKIISKTEQIKNPFLYSGEYWDDSTQLQYLRARWYSPHIGRFITEDTYEGELTNPLSLNLYTYVHNNPLKYVDPSGNDIMEVYIYQTTGYHKYENDWIYYGKNFKDIIAYNFMGGEEIFTLLNSKDPDELINSITGLSISFVPAAKIGKTAVKIGNYVDEIGDLTKLVKKAFDCNCFTSGTKVLTDEGEKPIEEIEVGDKVLAKSDETGEVAYKEVVGLFEKQAGEIYYIHIGDEIIEVTAEHPFWLDGKGWTEVKDLKVGDLLVSSDGTTLAIDKIEKEPREATVYNFEVEDFNSYFVSNFGIWVHNCAIATKNNYRKLYTDLNPGMPSNYQVHHTLPQKYDSIMKSAGINIHETKYLQGVDPKIHSKITTEWVQWDKSLGRTPTAKEVQGFAQQIDSKYGQYWYK